MEILALTVLIEWKAWRSPQNLSFQDMKSKLPPRDIYRFTNSLGKIYQKVLEPALHYDQDTFSDVPCAARVVFA